MSVSNRLRVLRAEMSWTQGDVAERIGVSRQAINAVENGKYDPGIAVALQLAALFGVPVEQVFSLNSSNATTD